MEVLKGSQMNRQYLLLDQIRGIRERELSMDFKGFGLSK